MTQQPSSQSRRPRLYLHPDGRTVSIGFNDTQDTLLFLDRVPGEYDGVDPAKGDIARLREWAASVVAVLERENS